MGLTDPSTRCCLPMVVVRKNTKMLRFQDGDLDGEIDHASTKMREVLENPSLTPDRSSAETRKIFRRGWISQYFPRFGAACAVQCSALSHDPGDGSGNPFLKAN